MAPLTRELRKLLRTTTLQARDAAERATRAALDVLAVNEPTAPPSFDDARRRLRNELRARARQLGGGSQRDGYPLLLQEAAYEQWHRLLFARFLAGNNLLLTADGVAVTLNDCDELARETGDRDADGWTVATTFAARLLPGIFRAGDPAVRLPLAREGRAALERLLAAMPPALFTADDALGWTYQFWQESAKQAINSSERKIGGADLGPVTQLFTEDYMVRFLLDNSLGAWWAARHLHSPLLRDVAFLRRRDDGTPVAGTFPGWPARVAGVTVLDPCCGSGHFLVAAFAMLRAMRMEEEGLCGRDAGEAVLRDNLFGLELDARCVQIAAFALALAAWKADGYRPLPPLNLACSGVAVRGGLDTWRRMAAGDDRASFALDGLYELFKDAPTLGSLIDPRALTGPNTLWNADFDRVAQAMQRALAREGVGADPTAAVLGHAAEGAARAGALLAGRYTLVATNVPYLKAGKQDAVLRGFVARTHPDAKADLATAFVERCRSFTQQDGTYALVAPQNWLFLSSYKKVRSELLREQDFSVVARLGSGARSTASWEVIRALTVISNRKPTEDCRHAVIDAPVANDSEKIECLLNASIQMVTQSSQLNNPNFVITIQSDQLRNPDGAVALEHSRGPSLLSDHAHTHQGMVTGDTERFKRLIWELATRGQRWEYCQGTVAINTAYGGLHFLLDWELEGTRFAAIKGRSAWGKLGIAVSQMRELPVSLYLGTFYDSNLSPIIPNEPNHLPAIWAFCQSDEFRTAVRRIDQKLNVTNGTLVKVPFDLERWQKVAAQAGPLPQPYSNDPTQWLFKGAVTDTTAPLQVAVARLLGYRWPEQATDGLEGCAAPDGILPLPPVAGHPAGADRLHALLAAAFGQALSTAHLDALLAAAGFGGKTLAAWLRDGFFKQHCALFHNRPFIWHICDGRDDGFAALVNYHSLDHATLQTLIYSYLAPWIAVQRDAVANNAPGADGRLAAAEALKAKLEAILDGEPPYDLYVRWKPLHQQPVGWNPDLNDGVRINVRPWVQAGVLRATFTVNWNVDRGKNPGGGARINDLHLSRAQKLAARAQARQS